MTTSEWGRWRVGGVFPPRSFQFQSQTKRRRIGSGEYWDVGPLLEASHHQTVTTAHHCRLSFVMGLHFFKLQNGALLWECGGINNIK